jgi:hypothetical protein
MWFIEISFTLIRAIAGSDYSLHEVLIAAGRLKDFGILHIRNKGLAKLPTYGMHQLYHAMIKDLLSSNAIEGQYEVSLASATETLFQVVRDCESESIVDCTTYIPHILNVMSRERDTAPPYLIGLMEKAESFLNIQGRWQEAMFVGTHSKLTSALSTL